MKKAVITGASSGLGKEIGKILVRNKIKVVNLSRKSSDFEDITIDLRNNDDILKAIDKIKENHSDLNLLILNAGTMPKAETGKIDFNINETFEINITATIKIVNGLIDLIKSNHGDIIIIGSTASFKFFNGDSVYSSTKYAVLGFIKSLQEELKREDVRVIGFHPGAFNSNLRGEGFVKDDFINPKNLAELLMSLISMPRNIQVSEIIVDRKK